MHEIFYKSKKEEKKIDILNKISIVMLSFIEILMFFLCVSDRWLLLSNSGHQNCIQYL